MMRGGACVLLLLLAPCLIQAAVSYERAVPDPNNPNACLILWGISLPVGESYTAARGCKDMFCTRQDGELRVYTATCGVTVAQPAFWKKMSGATTLTAALKRSAPGMTSAAP